MSDQQLLHMIITW